MNRLIVYALAVVSLNSFGAAELEMALLGQGAAKSDALQRLITVIPGSSKTPFRIAYREAGTERVYACLVASTELNKSTLLDVAQILVNALPVDDTNTVDLSVKDTSYLICKNIIHEKIEEGAVSREILSNALAAFFLLKKNVYGRPSVVMASFGPGAHGRVYYVSDKISYEDSTYSISTTMSGYMERSVGFNFKEYDLGAEINYDACMKHFPKPEVGCCSIL